MQGSSMEMAIVDQFHKLYWDLHVFKRTWADTYWLGTRVLKCPLDLWRYQEILFETKPDVILEMGTAMGGSAFYLASMCDLIGKGRIITVDVTTSDSRPLHPRIEYLTGFSTADDIVTRIRGSIATGERVMVILDSDHSRDNVAKELEIYAPLVSPGCYLIVEDTNINGHPVLPDFGPGPYEAVEEFLRGTESFTLEADVEKFLLTFNPRGYLRKIR